MNVSFRVGGIYDRFRYVIIGGSKLTTKLFLTSNVTVNSRTSQATALSNPPTPLDVVCYLVF